MSNGRRDAEPRVPDAEPPSTFISLPASEDVFPNPATVALGPNEVSIAALFWSPAAPPATIGAYAADGEEGLSKVERLIRERAQRLGTGKFSKYDTYYLPQTPIPFGVWEYKCETCRFYNARDARADGAGTCDVVGQEGDWFGGERVHPDAWCALWMPEEGRKWFDFIRERLEGAE